jgi:hypothetical protein
MDDRLFYPIAALAALALIALAAVWPQGLGARSPGPFGHTPEQQRPEVRAALEREKLKAALEAAKAAEGARAAEAQDAAAKGAAGPQGLLR